MPDNKEAKTFLERILDAQKAIGAIPKNKQNPFYKSNYVDINGLLEVVKPALEKEGILLSQALEARNGKNFVATYLCDVHSESRVSSKIQLPDEADPQKIGSAITYYRRYTLQSLLALEAEDDDGNAASSHAGGKTHSKQEAQEQEANGPEPTTAPATNSKAWMKSAKDEEHICKTCGAIATRSYGVSKKNKEFNMLKCSDKDDHLEWLDIVPAEMGGS